MSGRLNARERLARLLAVIPWVAGHDDGVSLDEVVARYAYPRRQLIDDLRDVVFFVGVHPFTPDALIEVELSDDRVRIRYADWFSRPLRLTPTDGARLLTAGRSVLASSDADPDTAPAGDTTSPLLRALTKVGTALGEGAADAVDVRLGHAPADTLGQLRDAIESARQVDIDYYTYGRDELTSRRVEPARVFSDQGHWYLSGWCHRAAGERVFRVDRIRSVVLTDDIVEHERISLDTAFAPATDDPRVVLCLRPAARWVVEQYPTESCEAVGDDLRVTMAVTAEPWLERLLLRLGPDVTVEAADPPLTADLRSRAASRVLARYGPTARPSGQASAR